MRLGISDYKNYVKRQFTNEQLITLNSCIASKRIIDQVDADIDECISSKSFIDLQSNLPSVFNEEDIKLILESLVTVQKQKQLLVFGSFILSTAFVEALSAPCDSIVNEKAKAVVESGRYQQYQIDLQMSSNKVVSAVETIVEDSKIDKREERRKKAAGIFFHFTYKFSK